jgi:hypothetical protein
VAIKPDALQSNAFDDLLTKNGIEWEAPQSAQGAAETSRESLAEESASGRKLAVPSRGVVRGDGGAQPVEELVFVAAPRATIESFLADLSQDQANYFAVEVASPAAKVNSIDAVDKSKVESIEPAELLAKELGARFNRGSMSQSAELAAATRHYDFFATAGQDSAPHGGFGGGGGLGGPRPSAMKQEQPHQSAEGEESKIDAADGRQLGRGRAWREQSWGFIEPQNRDELNAGGSAVFNRSVTSEAPQPSSAFGRQLELRAIETGDQLNVIFVLSPSAAEPAKIEPSPPAPNRQE